MVRAYLAAATAPVREAWVQPGSEAKLIRAITLVLLGFGLAAVFSASTVESLNSYGNAWSIFLKQLLFASFGVALMFLADRVPIVAVRRLALPALVFTLMLLVVVLAIGVTINGQKEWIRLGPFNVQPSEFAKLAYILFAADRAAAMSRRTSDAVRIGAPVIAAAIPVMVLVFLEKDMGNVFVTAGFMLALLFVIGYPGKRLASVSVSALAVVALVIRFGSRYRAERIMNWLDPYSDPQGFGWQWIHGNYALALGGFLGQGPGASKEKWGALPEAHTDFILAVIGEEYGFVGTCVTIGLILALIVLLIRVAMRYDGDPFKRLVITGMAAWLLSQSLFNVGAVAGLLPIVGVTLPLVSYGGSSLLPLLIGLGIVVRCLREPSGKEVDA